MPKFYCEYCDIYLTHSSPVGRRQHNHGRKHVSAKIEYFQNLIKEEGITPQNFLVFLNPRNYTNPLDPTCGGRYMNNYEMGPMYMKYDMRSGPYPHRHIPPYGSGNPYGIPSNKYIRAGHFSPTTSKYVNPKYIKGQPSTFGAAPNGPYSPNTPSMNASFQGAPPYAAGLSYNNHGSFMNLRPYNQAYPYQFQHNNNTIYNFDVNSPYGNNKKEITNQKTDTSNLANPLNTPVTGSNTITRCSNEPLINREVDHTRDKEVGDVNLVKNEISESKKSGIVEKER